MKPSEKTSVPERQKYIEIKHYIICDEVHKRESGSPIYISTDEQIRRYFGKASVQNERVYVLKLEIVETTSLLKKEEMTPRLGGRTNL
jgi:intergrase/recombinase